MCTFSHLRYILVRAEIDQWKQTMKGPNEALDRVSFFICESGRFLSKGMIGFKMGAAMEEETKIEIVLDKEYIYMRNWDVI